ncbi:MAG: AAA family ATPase [Acidimicrobiia bacterium]|nr:AAA family ATPase [Acidimicrobiia bacterium]MDQ3501816.1 AAA family ATPase [Actinomycetota bacterium]
MTAVDRLDVSRFADRFAGIADNIERVIQGKRSPIEQLLTCLIAEGHVLIEDVPGVGKTLLAKSLARSIDCEFNRIQFTPDLLPSDVTGVSIWDRHESAFVFKPGAIFANIVVGDEINRASPKTQAALLEAMEERQVTTDGKTKLLPEPFMVVATQNPIEHEGTYPLPEAQLDRFMMRVSVGYPSRDKELEMLETHSLRSTFEDLEPVVSAGEVGAMIEIARRVEVVPAVRSYIIDIVEGTRRHPEVLLGASPRSALYLQKASRARAASEERDYVTPDDVKILAGSVLEHRLAFRPEAQMRGVTSGELIASVLGSTRIPIHRTS